MKKTLFAALLLMNTLVAAAQLKPGEKVPEISLPGTNDSIVNLSSFAGKVVLIDFWASWCTPCRAKNPSVVALYKKYKCKGFEVFGVSIDNKKDKWMKAISQDRITYCQVYDSTAWNSAIADKYFVNEIPASFLIDKQGKLVAIDAEGRQLDKKIRELLK